MGGGWYRTAYYPVEVLIERRPVDSLADELVRDATEGVAGTGVRIGILGEIGTDKPWVTPAEERVFRAVARCARRTGLAISTHAVMSDVGAAQLTVLLEEGVDPARVVIGHSDSYPVLAHYLALIERGASIEFDFLGMSSQPRRSTARGASSTCCWSCSTGVTSIACCSASTCATTASCAGTRATATRTSRTRSCRGSASEACPGPRSTG